MTERTTIIAIGASLVALLFVLELVRQRRLREEYSLLWLATAVVMLVMSLWRDLLHGLSAAVGVVYPPNLLFLVGVLFVLFILLYFSTVITRLTQENKTTAQELALLRYELEDLRQRTLKGGDGEDENRDQGDTIR
jgi:hypothetical protein